jgi:hypothetical protein
VDAVQVTGRCSGGNSFPAKKGWVVHEDFTMTRDKS